MTSEAPETWLYIQLRGDPSPVALSFVPQVEQVPRPPIHQRIEPDTKAHGFALHVYPRSHPHLFSGRCSRQMTLRRPLLHVSCSCAKSDP